MRRHRRDYELLSEMNLTNLLDTAFVLLIAFILVSPTMRTGLKVDLPQVASSDLTSTVRTVSIVIKMPDSVGGDDKIYLDDNRIELKDLESLVSARKRMDPKMDITIEADRNTRYETFVKVIGVLKAMGVENVGLPTEPLDTTKDEKKVKDNRLKRP